MNASIIISLFIVMLIIFGFLFFVMRCLIKVKPGDALVRTGLGGEQVSFSSMLVLPAIHEYHVIDISTKKCRVEFLGKESLKTKSGQNVEVIAILGFGINRSSEHVKIVYQTAGIDNLKNPSFVQNHFYADVSEAIRSVFCSQSVIDHEPDTIDKLKQEIAMYLGVEFFGFYLEGITFEKLVIVE